MMHFRRARKYAAAAAGVAVALAAVIASGLYLGGSALDRILQATVEQRGHAFASFLTGPRGSAIALTTGISRDPDLRDRITSVARLSGIADFSIFDTSGKLVFASETSSNEWTIRNATGDKSSARRLSSEYVDRADQWVVVDDIDSPRPLAVLPLDLNGERLGFLAATVDIHATRESYSKTLDFSFLLLLGLSVSLGSAPVLIILRRRWRTADAEERIYYLANHDSLTHLLNRRRMQDETDRVLATARATREKMALWYLDVEGLGDINNHCGQSVGDDLLRLVSTRLRSVIDRQALLARIAGDDFGMLQRHVTSRADLKLLASKIVEAVEAPVEIEGHKLTPRLSIGVSYMPDHGRTYTDLIRHAELACHVHRSSRNLDFVLFDASMDEEAHRRRAIEARIRHAVETKGFQLFYQPIVDAGDHTLLGFEALIRLPDGNGGFIPPNVFLPVAEARGFIKQIGDWVIGEAARQVAEWPEHLYVSVNLSPVQFKDGDLVQIVQSAVESAGIEGRRLELEVVESLVLERSDTILDQLRALKQLGVSIAMDDFGTGYSSLGYLWRFSFDKLKIDQSFMVAYSAGEANVTQILETIISLAHGLQMKVTAEGVETTEQSSALRALGCNQLQGYHFGRPMPAEQVACDVLRNLHGRMSALQEPVSEGPAPVPDAWSFDTMAT